MKATPTKVSTPAAGPATKATPRSTPAGAKPPEGHPPALTGAKPPASGPASGAAPAPLAAAPAPKRAAPTEAQPAGLSEEDDHADPPGAKPKKQKRQQMSVVLDIDISQARCSTHLKTNLSDPSLDESIRELRDQLKAVKSKDPAKEKALKEEIAALSLKRIRFSADTAVAAAVVMDRFVKEYLVHGMTQATARNRKMVEVSHLHEGEPEHLLYYPIISELASFKNYNDGHEAELREHRAAANKAAKEQREAKKTVGKGAGAPKPGGKAPPKAANDDSDGGRVVHGKTKFITYVENALKTVKKDDRFRGMRVSNRVREYVSELVEEALAHIAEQARVLVLQVAGVRTLNASHIKSTVNLMFTSHGTAKELIDQVTKQVDEKLAVFHEHLRSEKAKKLAEMPEDKKVQLDQKKMTSDLLRKQKQAAAAQERARVASAKAQALLLETEKLAPLVASFQREEAASAEAARAEAANGHHADE